MKRLYGRPVNRHCFLIIHLKATRLTENTHVCLFCLPRLWLTTLRYNYRYSGKPKQVSGKEKKKTATTMRSLAELSILIYSFHWLSASECCSGQETRLSGVSLWFLRRMLWWVGVTVGWGIFIITGKNWSKNRDVERYSITMSSYGVQAASL